VYFASADGVSACGLTETEAVMESFADGDANCVDASSEGVFVLEDTRLVQYGGGDLVTVYNAEIMGKREYRQSGQISTPWNPRKR